MGAGCITSGLNGGCLGDATENDPNTSRYFLSSSNTLTKLLDAFSDALFVL